MEQVYITGLGVISSIGNSVDENYLALSECRPGIGPLTLFDTLSSTPVGEVKFLFEEKNISRSALLGAKAAQEALADSGFTKEELESGYIRAGLISSTTVGGMDITERIYPSLSEKELYRNHPTDFPTRYIASKLGIREHIATISTACSSAANAILVGERLVRNNILDLVIVGGCDALSKFTCNGFNSLKILSEKHCTPFDDNREGLNLGEGAGYLVLQNSKYLRREPYGRVAGAANANDAYHQTASSEDGEGDYLAMKYAIENAGITPDEIDYINVHGTGTPNNDSSEFAAMARIWGDGIPPFSSTKYYTGHTLAAAGGIEAVYSVLSLKYGAVYSNPTTHSVEKLPIRIMPQKSFREGADVRYVLSNSFGFGGNATSIVFGKIDKCLENECLENGVEESEAAAAPNGRIYLHNITCFDEKMELKQLIPDANLRRRMSSWVKMGVATAMKCLGSYSEKFASEREGAEGLAKPDAIITATWLGALADSEKFLKNFIENGESLLNPTPFIQSTANAIGGQIALLTRNRSYNVTYTDNGRGLENAITDALLLIDGKRAESVLVGIVNESTPTLELITEAICIETASSKLKCNIPQQGATFFILSNKWSADAKPLDGKGSCRWREVANLVAEGER